METKRNEIKKKMKIKLNKVHKMSSIDDIDYNYR